GGMGVRCSLAAAGLRGGAFGGSVRPPPARRPPPPGRPPLRPAGAPPLPPRRQPLGCRGVPPTACPEDCTPDRSRNLRHLRQSSAWLRPDAPPPPFPATCRVPARRLRPGEDGATPSGNHGAGAPAVFP